MDSLFIEKYIWEFYELFNEKIDGYGVGFVGTKGYIKLLMEIKLNMFVDTDLVDKTLNEFRILGLLERKTKHCEIHKTIVIREKTFESKNLYFFGKIPLDDSLFKKEIKNIVAKFINADNYFSELLSYEEIIQLVDLENKKIKTAQDMVGLSFYENFKWKYELPTYEFGMRVTEYKQQIDNGEFPSDFVIMIKYNLSREGYNRIYKKFKYAYSKDFYLKVKESIDNENGLKNAENNLLNQERDVINLMGDYSHYGGLQDSKEYKLLKKIYTVAFDIIKRQCEKFGYIEIKMCRRIDIKQGISDPVIISMRINNITFGINRPFFITGKTNEYYYNLIFKDIYVENNLIILKEDDEIYIVIQVDKAYYNDLVILNANKDTYNLLFQDI